jgi:ribosomal protein S12 methylthiotransferase accessory factor
MSNEADAIRLTEALVSRRCGLVTDLAPQMRGPDEPCPPHLWNATLAHYNFPGSPLAMRVTGGKGRTKAEAKLSALGEAMERYAAFLRDPARIREGAAAENAITPPECVLYSAGQYAAGVPYQQWSPEVSMSWITGTELPMGTPVELPASFVYLLGPASPQADDFAAVTSNGLSAGQTLSHAILGGAYECIERDAFMISWLNQLPATLIRTPQTGCAAAAIIRQYRRFGVTLWLVLLHTDQAAHVVMAVADDPTGGSAFRMMGLGCDMDPVAAVDKAVFELCQLRPGMATRMHGSDYLTRLTSYEAVKTLDDHPLYHAIPAHADALDFLTASGAECELEDMARPLAAPTEAALEHVVQKATATGVRVAYADITPSDIAALGPRVVRVIMTGLQPIHFGHGQGRYGGARLFDAPVQWGLRDAPLSEAELNPCPHPLA